MNPKYQNYVCRNLAPILKELSVGEHVPQTDQFQNCLFGIEWVTGSLLGEVHADWDDSCDGIGAAASIKTGEHELSLLGYYFLLADQTAVPCYVCLQISPADESISWIECGIGEKGPAGMRREPATSLHRMMNRIYVIDGWTEPKRWATLFDWAYIVTRGHR